MTKAINSPVTELEDFVWTAELYNQMITAGVLTPEFKVELLDGAIINKMAINEAHAACVDGLQEYFYDKFRKQFTYRSENPVALDERSVPEPDFVVCVRKEDRYVSGHPKPQEVHLIVEVADPTVDKDRYVKAKRYAKAGIKEYWIINLRDRQVEVHLQPDPGSEAYRQIARYPEGTTFESPFNGTTIVNKLLPEKKN